MPIKDRKTIESIFEAQKKMLTARPKPKTRENVQRRNSAGLWVRPFHSDALGVNPDQIEEARENLRAHGVMADFDEEGRCIITSDKQRREVAKACGLWSGRDGYDVKDSEGGSIPTGRKREELKDDFRRAVARGDYDHF